MHDVIPLVDLGVQHAQIAEEIAEGWDRVVASGGFILGEEVDAFERAFASASGVDHLSGWGTARMHSNWRYASSVSTWATR